jgi:hypothetical protein
MNSKTPQKENRDWITVFDVPHFNLTFINVTIGFTLKPTSRGLGGEGFNPFF